MARSWRLNGPLERHLRDIHALHPDQFMPAGELRRASPNDWTGEHESEEEFWERKGQQALRKGLDRSIAQKGILTPVVVHHDEADPLDAAHVTLLSGHHRVAIASAHNPDMPVPFLRYGQTYWY